MFKFLVDYNSNDNNIITYYKDLIIMMIQIILYDIQ
jgi:hypothetical protein